MPYKVRKMPNGKWRLWNIEKKQYAKAHFNSKEAALKQSKNWMRYSD